MKKLFLLSAFVFGLLLFSCSSDDDNNEEGKINLEGDWQLTNVDFTTRKEGGFPASDACIVELVSGYRFEADSRLYIILGDSDKPLFDPYAKDYWTWEGDADQFIIEQINPKSPPYNFSLTPTNLEVKKVNDKTTMTFHSEMSNGSAANFTLVKEKIDQKKLPMLTSPDGSEFYCGFFD